MLVVISHIFMADTKIIFNFNSELKNFICDELFNFVHLKHSARYI